MLFTAATLDGLVDGSVTATYRRWTTVRPKVGSRFTTRAGMVEVARARMPGATFVRGDALDPPFEAGAFERVHAGHFYGHLVPEQRTAFLALAARLAGELVITDSALRPDGAPEAWQERELNDGSRHRVYKRWFTAAGLAEELGGGETVHDGPWFVAVRLGA